MSSSSSSIPHDDDMYINEDRLNKYKRLIEIKRNIETKLTELRNVMEQDEMKITNADLNELAGYLREYEQEGAGIDESFNDPDKYVRSWNNLSFSPLNSTVL